jgi:hypothetical protein
MKASANRRPLDGQLSLFDAPTARRKRYIPTYAGDFSATHARLDAIHAQFRGLKPYEGRCPRLRQGHFQQSSELRSPLLSGCVQELVT